MTSYFASHYGFSLETYEAAAYGAEPRDVNDRVDFYMKYFRDVVPHGVTVQHVPGYFVENTSEEIRLLTPAGEIFMSGLVRKDRNHKRSEDVAAGEAYTHWLNGEFVPDGLNWRFFTCHDSLRLFNSEEGDEFVLAHCFRPMESPLYVAQFLQEEYDSLSYQ